MYINLSEWDFYNEHLSSPGSLKTAFVSASEQNDRPWFKIKLSYQRVYCHLLL